MEPHAQGTRPSPEETVGFLIPEFPGQTHIAWWRVAREMRRLGYDVQMMSTRRQKPALAVHELLKDDAEKLVCAWPPDARNVLVEILRNPVGVGRAIAYLASLRQSSIAQKTALLPVLLSALHLSAVLRQKGIRRVFVHSCATAAHLLAMCNRIMGVRYGLRLGGDPEVYGRDHFHKMQKADFVLSASPTYFDELVDRHGVDRSKLFWSWVGTDLDFYSVAETWPQNRVDGILRVVTVARLNATKGHHYALEAVRDLVSSGLGVDYTLVGSGPYRDEIETYVAHHGLGAHVHLEGARDAAGIAGILRSSDVFVLPSFGLGEAAPAAVCEAMASGVPVIATRIGATEHMIRDGLDGFLVPQRDSASIRRHLQDLATDPDRLEAMKRAARASSARFDVRLTAERVLDLFETDLE